MKRALIWLSALGLVTSSAALVAPSPAHAAIVVNETADEINADGDCSLAEAVQALNTGVAVDACPAPTDATITLPAGTYDLGAGVVTTTTASFVGAGAGATILDCSAAPVCINNFGAGADLEVSSLSMRDSIGHHVNHLLGAGDLAATDVVFERSGDTALRSPAEITLVRSQVIDSGGIGVGADGGAWLIDSEVVGADFHGVTVSDGQLELQRSTVSGSGGAGVVNDEGSIVLLDSTVDHNELDGLATDEGDITVVNSTISTNGSHGIRTTDGALHIESSTIVHNTFRAFSWSGSGSAYLVNSLLHNTIEECDNPSMVSGGFNLTDEDVEGGCNFDQPTDRTTSDPTLGALADNGGPTQTHLPLAGSPAIDGGGDCQAGDQRGESRPVDGDGDGTSVCDVGSVEVPAPPVPESGDGADDGSESTDSTDPIVSGGATIPPGPAQPLRVNPSFTG